MRGVPPVAELLVKSAILTGLPCLKRLCLSTPRCHVPPSSVVGSTTDHRHLPMPSKSSSSTTATVPGEPCCHAPSSSPHAPLLLLSIPVDQAPPLVKLSSVPPLPYSGTPPDPLPSTTPRPSAERHLATALCRRCSTARSALDATRERSRGPLPPPWAMWSWAMSLPCTQASARSSSGPCGTVPLGHDKHPLALFHFFSIFAKFKCLCRIHLNSKNYETNLVE
jgi:hypothetical protein